MSDKSGRASVVTAGPFSFVRAAEDEAPDYWLLREDSDPFPIEMTELHDLMDAIDAFHDEAHTH